VIKFGGQTLEKVVFVNVTAAVKGGAFRIAEQVLDLLERSSVGDIRYYVFCTKALSASYRNLADNIVLVDSVKGKKWISRLWWDLAGMRLWSIRNAIKPDLVISLQNTGVGAFRRTKQIVYIQQALPFTTDVHWSVFDSHERRYWFYKNIYKWLIRLSIGKNTQIVVQTRWMKHALMRAFRWDPTQISIIKPEVQICDPILSDIEDEKRQDGRFCIFYPATPAPYKNHRILVEALRVLQEEDPSLVKEIRLCFTVEGKAKDSRPLRDLVDRYGLGKEIRFMGSLSYRQVLSYYRSCDLVVFPSYVESCGLPLLEAASLGKPVLASNREFAREVIGGYEGVTFVECDKPHAWARSIKQMMEFRANYQPYAPNHHQSMVRLVELITELVGEPDGSVG